MRLQVESPASGLLPNALGAGFGSYNQFARVFWKAFGCTPAEYFRQTDRLTVPTGDFLTASSTPD